VCVYIYIYRERERERERECQRTNQLLHNAKTFWDTFAFIKFDEVCDKGVVNGGEVDM